MIHRLFNILTTATLLLIFSAVALTPSETNATEQDVSSNSATENDDSPRIKVGPIIYLTIFVLAVFVGFEIITKIPPTLHTPLMSGSNAISGITIIGAIMCSYSESLGSLGVVLGVLAVVFATINVVGGFLVTHRMVGMFKKRD